MAGTQLGRLAWRLLARCSGPHAHQATAELARECGPCAATGSRRWFAAQPQEVQEEDRFQASTSTLESGLKGNWRRGPAIL
jgi:hypothetical protein